MKLIVLSTKGCVKLLLNRVDELAALVFTAVVAHGNPQLSWN